MTEPQLIRAGYDSLAVDCADHWADELDTRPVDRAIVDAFAELVGSGRVADVGCGPGIKTAYLHERGLDAFGIDLSPQMVAVARERHPHVRFEVGTMLALDVPDASLAGVAAMFSIIHVTEDRLPTVFAEFARVLAPGGQVLLVFQTDAETLHKSEAFGRPIDIDFLRHPVELVVDLLSAAGLAVHARLIRERDETMTARYAYLLARKEE
ncbi:class I SAM-dependent DNA methyltransferase [Cryptosporangium phraense]|uniref:Class I SAM-dependent methyltransferase n=1 Tax=Cryptosporangium phraense TaxID=2593070 RepID=A0A545AI29_9ACTN|nr:class I SAM-dependent methyltransferase [Cryptosporangium phraense]TQS40973.1 class I SAM-dependent methyltransferase [Cryptosporangium phraense]